MNHFETIEASPAWDDKTITMHIQRSPSLPAHKKNMIRQKLLNPKERMLQEIKTFHDPDYSVEVSDDKYTGFINDLLDDEVFAASFSPALTNYLFQKFKSHSHYPELNDSKEDRANLYSLILKDLKKDPWIIHSLALLYERYYLFLKEKNELGSALKQLETSMDYWVQLLEDNDFHQNFYTYRQAKGEKRKKECAQVWLEIFEEMIKKQHDRFRSYLATADMKNAALYFKMVEKMCGYEKLKDTATTTLDLLISDIINELDNTFKAATMETNYSGDFDAVFNYFKKINAYIGQNQRLITYELVKYNKYLYELYMAGDFNAVKKKTSAVDDLLNRINRLKSKSGHLLSIDQELKKLGEAYTGIGVASSNQAINLYNDKKAKEEETILKIDDAIGYLEKAAKLDIARVNDHIKRLREQKQQLKTLQLLSRYGNTIPPEMPKEKKKKIIIRPRTIISRAAFILMLLGATYSLIFLPYKELSILLLAILTLSWAAAYFNLWREKTGY